MLTSESCSLPLSPRRTVHTPIPQMCLFHCSPPLSPAAHAFPSNVPIPLLTTPIPLLSTLIPQMCLSPCSLPLSAIALLHIDPKACCAAVAGPVQLDVPTSAASKQAANAVLAALGPAKGEVLVPISGCHAALTDLLAGPHKNKQAAL